MAESESGPPQAPVSGSAHPPNSAAGGPSPGGRKVIPPQLIVVTCLTVVAAMVGLSFAAIPLYKTFCQVTGFGGTVQQGTHAPGAVGAVLYTVHFDANVAPGLPWDFAPEQRSVTLKPGEQKLAVYRAKNDSDKPLAGQALFNVTPDLAGQYFTKIACFCFTEQHLAAHQAADMPVTFYIDPAILKDPDLKTVRSITLSYTFYPATSEKTEKTSPKAEVAPAGPGPQNRPLRVGLAPTDGRTNTD